MKPFKYIKFGLALIICSYSYANTPFQEYSRKLSENVTLNLDAPAFAYTNYTREGYEQLYYKDYKAYEKVRWAVSDKRKEYQNYLLKTFQKDKNNNFVVTPKQWGRLILESPYNRLLMFGNLQIRDTIVSANNELINAVKSGVETNERLKSFLVELESFNSALQLLGTDKMTPQQITIFKDFCYKYLR